MHLRQFSVCSAYGRKICQPKYQQNSQVLPLTELSVHQMDLHTYVQHLLDFFVLIKLFSFHLFGLVPCSRPCCFS